MSRVKGSGFGLYRVEDLGFRLSGVGLMEECLHPFLLRNIV